MRPAIGRAVLGSMLLAIVFFAFTWLAKELPALYAHEPWQDDPYDAMVSFAIWCGPLLTALCVLRAVLCRRDASLPVRRAIDLLGASRVLVGIVLVTLASDWVSVVLGAHRDAWTAATAVLVCLLTLLTWVAVATAGALRRARRAPLRESRVPGQPDWLADAVALGEREAWRLGPWREQALTAVRWLDGQVVGRVRCHPLSAAGLFSLAFGAAVAAPQILLEGYAPSFVAFFLAVTACGMFAFVVIVGAHLHVVERRVASPSRAVRALVLACASVPLTVAFRGSMWWALATNDEDAGVAQLTTLMLVVALATAAIVIAGESLIRGRRG